MSGRRAFLIVLDSVGCGALPDASQYGDQGANTLAHVARAAGGLSLPNLEALGLGCVTQIDGVSCSGYQRGIWGRMAEVSAGKDTTTGHWELMGLPVLTPFRTYPSGFPAQVMDRFSALTGYGWLGNVAASGTEILERLGGEHLSTGKLIVYTSADSVFQIAAHESVVPVGELYRVCEIVRDQVLVGEHAVARVIARPFEGSVEDGFRRTSRRHDYSLAPTGATALDVLVDFGVPVYGVGKISDIFAGRGVTVSIPTASNDDGMDRVIELVSRVDSGLVFVNLVDFDMVWGHRRDAIAYGRGLEKADARLGQLMDLLADEDLLIVTADHGCDPTHVGSDHTREYVPVLAVTGLEMSEARTFGGDFTAEGNAGSPAHPGGDRDSFADVAATVLAWFGIDPSRRVRGARASLSGYRWEGSPLTIVSAGSGDSRIGSQEFRLPRAVCDVIQGLGDLGVATSDLYLVGGLVRDAILGEGSQGAPDVDLVLVGDLNTVLVAAESAGRHTVLSRNDQLRTARVLDLVKHIEFDIAESRAEYYDPASAYPVQTVSVPIEWDLSRRDFTVNALALAAASVQLDRCSFEQDDVIDLHGGVADLRAGLLRVLHDRSFEDDPTRLIRMMRFSRRLRLQPEPHTLRLASASLESGSLQRVSDRQLHREISLLEGEWKADTVGD